MREEFNAKKAQWDNEKRATSSSVGMESISVRMRAQASSIKSMALSGRKRSVMYLSAAVRRNRVGISPKHKPVSFIFVGPTGVGKVALPALEVMTMMVFSKDTTRPWASVILPSSRICSRMFSTSGWADRQGGLRPQERRPGYPQADPPAGGGPHLRHAGLRPDPRPDADPVQFKDRVVAIMEARDGTILDVVREIKPYSYDG